MRINTKAVFEWNSDTEQYEEIYSEGYDYEGEVDLFQGPSYPSLVSPDAPGRSIVKEAAEERIRRENIASSHALRESQTRQIMEMDDISWEEANKTYEVVSGEINVIYGTAKKYQKYIDEGIMSEEDAAYNFQSHIQKGRESSPGFADKYFDVFINPETGKYYTQSESQRGILSKNLPEEGADDRAWRFMQEGADGRGDLPW